MGWKVVRHYLMVYSTVDTQLGVNTKRNWEKWSKKYLPDTYCLEKKKSDDCTAVPITSETDVSHSPSVQVEITVGVPHPTFGFTDLKNGCNLKMSRKYGA